MKTRTNNSSSVRTSSLLSFAAALAATGLTSVNALADDTASFASRPVTATIESNTDARKDVGDQVAQPILIMADADHSGHIDAADLFVFLEAWMLGRPNADVDGNGRIDIADVYLYLSVWQVAFGRPTALRPR